MEEIRGKAPLRVSFAGGGTDLNDVFEKYGGAVINMTINKYIHMTIVPRRDNRIRINDTDDIDEFTLRVLQRFNKGSGLDIYYYNDIAPGRGLGSSSAYSILLGKLLCELNKEKIDKEELVKRVYGIESEVGKCGWQDQYAVASGGINFIEFKKEKTVVYPLRIKHETLKELEAYMVLVFTNKHHDAKALEKKNVRHINKEKAEGLKKYAEAVRDCLLNDKINPIGELLHNSWQLKRNKITSNKEIDRMYDIGRGLGALGGKVLGAGDGGYMLFFVNPKIKREFIEYFKAKGYEIILPELAEKGVETWSP